MAGARDPIDPQRGCASASLPLESPCIITYCPLLNSASSAEIVPVHALDPPKVTLDTSREVVKVLDEVLHLGGRASAFTADSPLLGAIPELDSMAVVSILTLLEERFGFVVEDDEMDGSVFATVGALTGFVNRKLDG